MPLRYGFNLDGWGENKKHWEDKYQALSEKDKNFYHNVLCWILMVVDIGHVSKQTIPIIIVRHKLNSILSPGTIDRVTEEYLQKFIGYEANVNTCPDKEFYEKLIRTKMSAYGTQVSKFSFKTERQIKKEFKQYIKEIYNRETKY